MNGWVILQFHEQLKSDIVPKWINNFFLVISFLSIQTWRFQYKYLMEKNDVYIFFYCSVAAVLCTDERVNWLPVFFVNIDILPQKIIIYIKKKVGIVNEPKRKKNQNNFELIN
jgi:hypothetical protein